MKEKHKGFAATLEVMVTMAMLMMFMLVTVYTVRITNAQRYMNTVITSTAASAARWGGVNSNAFKKNVGSGMDGITLAKQQLGSLVNEYNIKFTKSADTITTDDGAITVGITYELPYIGELRNVENGLDKTSGISRTKMSMSVTVYSVMEKGKLL